MGGFGVVLVENIKITIIDNIVNISSINTNNISE